MFLKDYIKDVYGAVKSLLKGMRMTGYYFTHRKEIITEQYPDNRDTLKLAERFRGEVVLKHDENNEHACTGCSACELACPNGTIKIINKFDISPEGKKKKAITKPNSLRMAQKYALLLILTEIWLKPPPLSAFQNCLNQ